MVQANAIFDCCSVGVSCLRDDLATCKVYPRADLLTGLPRFPFHHVTRHVAIQASHSMAPYVAHVASSKADENVLHQNDRGFWLVSHPLATGLNQPIKNEVYSFRRVHM